MAKDVTKHDPVISVRLPPETLAAIDRCAVEERKLRSAVTREALVQAFPPRRGRPPKGERAMTAAERKQASRAKGDPSITVSLPVELLSAVNVECLRQKMTREALVRAALTAFLRDAEEARAVVREPAPKAPGVERLVRPDHRKPSPLYSPAQAALDVVSGEHCPKCGRLYALVGRSHLCEGKPI